ncbi:MAG TPA: glycosyltransferase family 2 protein [Candidatus Kapabacteria bacterium]|nr:glycosyltransferase family 2 protein [Candidatus Kapabacteria bacterium]
MSMCNANKELSTVSPQSLSILVESQGDLENLKKRLEALTYGMPSYPGHCELCVVYKEAVRARVEPFLQKYYGSVTLKVLPDEPGMLIGPYLLNTIRSEKVAFMPESPGLAFYIPEMGGGAPGSIIPWLNSMAYPLENAQAQQWYADGWLCHTRTAQEHLSLSTCLEDWGCVEMIKRGRLPALSPHVDAGTLASPALTHSSKVPALNSHSRIMAIVPHYKCEEWLFQCLESLVNQTHPLDAIVVVDDDSPAPPVDIVKQFPRVTLFKTMQNVGPYRIIQQVIDQFDYDAYLFQDADDWSTIDRLEILLKEAERTGAELIGSQEMQIICNSGCVDRLQPVYYPLDVNRALMEKPSHALLHPTSLVSRNLVKRIGGFATGLKFGGDSEFILRATYMGRIVNTPAFCYFRRKRPGALTSAASTGIGSPARQELILFLINRAWENITRRNAGSPLLLEPMKLHPPVTLKLLCRSSRELS